MLGRGPALIAAALAVAGALALASSQLLAPKVQGVKASVGLGEGPAASATLWLAEGDIVAFKFDSLANGTLSISGSGGTFVDSFREVKEFAVLHRLPSGLYNITVEFSGEPPKRAVVEVVGPRPSPLSDALAVAGLALLAASPGYVYAYYYRKAREYPGEAPLEGGGSCRTLGYNRHECVLPFAGDPERALAALAQRLESMGYAVRRAAGALFCASRRGKRRELVVEAAPGAVRLRYLVARARSHGSRDLAWVVEEARALAGALRLLPREEHSGQRG